MALHHLRTAIMTALRLYRLPVVVTGDFNARLGSAMTGDHDQNGRRHALLQFVAESGLELLNRRIRSQPNRWTWLHRRSRDGHLTKSVVDLAMTANTLCDRIDVLPPPYPTPHQVVIVSFSDGDVDVTLEPWRWNWARRMFSTKENSDLCADLLMPYLVVLRGLWVSVSSAMDDSLRLSGIDDDHDHAGACQQIVDWLYELTCDCLRRSLLNVACWSPSMARRGYQPQVHIDWGRLEATANGFFLRSVKSVITDYTTTESLSSIRQDEQPSMEQFISSYRTLFARAADTPSWDRIRSPKPTSSLGESEKVWFGVEQMKELLKRSRWKKAIGPDNLPSDLFKCCPGPASEMLSVMFIAIWTHQTVPSAWADSYLVPIPKSGSDLRDPTNWRGIAIQSHLKKMFEACVRRYMTSEGWLRADPLQLGFQSRLGAIDAVFVADELTSRYAQLKKPLIMTLLDIRKAYDRTPRALVWSKLRRRAVTEHIVCVLQGLMDECSIRIRLGTDLSVPIPLEVGVPQGDVLSPDLFNVYVDDLPNRVRAACAPFQGCPRYAGANIPMIMYADDQTLFHWDPAAMQAMISVVEQYAREHFYQYNVGKCVTSWPSGSCPRPLLLNGEPIPVSDATLLLGVRVRKGRIDHAAQLRDRCDRAARALRGIDYTGALRTHELSPAKKRLIITAFGRSRIEYGIAIANHNTGLLRSADTVIRKMSGRCLGVRGTALSMRLMGLVPARARQAQLRLDFWRRLEQTLLILRPASLPARIYKYAKTDSRSRLYLARRQCPFRAYADRQIPIFRNRIKARLGDRPYTGYHDVLADFHSSRSSLRALAWEPHSHLKLISLQRQDYRDPHPIAFLAGEQALAAAQWITNGIPGGQWPCSHCDGRYRVSRYHLTRCADATGALGEEYDAAAHLLYYHEAETAIDAMVIALVPEELHAAALIAADLSPTLPAPPKPNPAPIYGDRIRQQSVLAIGRAAQQMRAICGPPGGGQRGRTLTGSTVPATDGASDESSDPEHGRDDDSDGAINIVLRDLFTGGAVTRPPALPPDR